MKHSCQHSVWFKILSSPSSSDAIRLASDVHPSELTSASLPLPPNELSLRASDNLVAVCRALQLRIDGLASNLWSEWSESEDDLSPNSTDPHHAPSNEPSRNVHHGDKQLDQPQVSTASQTLPSGPSSSVLPHSEPAHDVRQPSSETKRILSTPESECNKSQMCPTEGDFKHVTCIKNWAQTSAHTAPPEASILHVTQAESFQSLLKDLVPTTASPTFRAAVLSAFVGKIPSSVAPVVQAHVILPFLKDLTTPAPREMLSAILTFTTRHPRPAVLLYSHFFSGAKVVSTGVAEVLTLIVPTLPQQTVFDAFKLISGAAWPDMSIPLVAAMLTRCECTPEFLDLLIPALDRNVPDLNKSVRFGKLLFTLVNDYPQIRQSYKQPMEAICMHSKVFLAKGALTLLQSQDG